LNRREFLKAGLTAGVGLLGAQFVGAQAEEGAAYAAEKWPDIVVVHGSNPGKMARVALQNLGGISRFVPEDSKVVIKPNASFARKPDQATTTHPYLLKATVGMCNEAGAKQVLVMDRTLDEWRSAVAENGLKAAAEAAGAQFIAPMDRALYQEVSIPRGKGITSDLIVRDVLNANVLINLPIAKHHGSSVVTIGMKNWMGVSWNRGSYHSVGLHQCIADLNTKVRARLTIVDCFRVLIDGGPGGPGQIREPRVLVAGTDPIALDCYACRYLFRDPSDVPHLVIGAQMGIGQFDLSQLNIVTVEA
jgi:uncharacterized protein (DUF362 family)